MSSTEIKKAIIYAHNYYEASELMEYCQNKQLLVTDFIKFEYDDGFLKNYFLKNLEKYPDGVALVIKEYGKFEKTDDDDIFIHRLIEMGCLELHFTSPRKVFNKDNTSKTLNSNITKIEWTEAEPWLNEKNISTIIHRFSQFYTEVKEWHDRDVIPLGFKRMESGKYYITQIEGEVIKQLFTLYGEQNYSLDTLVEWFNNLNWFKDTTIPYTKKDVISILSNPVYYGRLVPMSSICSSLTIISKELFAKVQQRLMSDKSLFLALDSLNKSNRLYADEIPKKEPELISKEDNDAIIQKYKNKDLIPF